MKKASFFLTFSVATALTMAPLHCQVVPQGQLHQVVKNIVTKSLPDGAFGQMEGAKADPTAVSTPEPATYSMLLIGLSALIIGIHRRQAKLS